MTATLLSTNLALTVPSAALAKSLKLVGRAINDKPVLPVLATVRIEAVEDQLTLTGTDLELGIRVRLPAQVSGPGSICLPAKLLTEFADALVDGPLHWTLKPGTFTVRFQCGRNEANINGQGDEDYPRVFIDDLAESTSVTLPAQTLKGVIADTVFSASQKNVHAVLECLYLKLSDGILTLAAADGFRLAVRSAEVLEHTDPIMLLVPAKAMQHLAALLPDDDTPVTLTSDDAHHLVRFAWGDIEVTSRLVDGQFPDYSRIIPTATTTRIVVQVAELLQATRTAVVFSRDNSNIVRLTATPGESDPDGSVPGELRVHTTSAELGDEESSVTAAVEGDPMLIAFNGRYLREALDALKTGEVALEMSGPTTPGLLKPVGRDDLFYCVMPMHLTH